MADLPASPAEAAPAIARALRALVKAGLVDYNGHASLRLAGGGFAINSGGSNRRNVTPDQISHVADDGSPIDGPRPPNEVALHAAILSARPDLACVVHGHPPWSVLFTAAGQPIPTVFPQGVLVADLPVYPASHSISTPERGQAVAALMGDGPGALLASHGSVFGGTTPAQAMARMIYAEQNAERAWRALPLGGARPIPDEDAAEYQRTLENPNLFEKCLAFFGDGD